MTCHQSWACRIKHNFCTTDGHCQSYRGAGLKPPAPVPHLPLQVNNNSNPPQSQEIDHPSSTSESSSSSSSIKSTVVNLSNTNQSSPPMWGWSTASSNAEGISVSEQSHHSNLTLQLLSFKTHDLYLTTSLLIIPIRSPMTLLPNITILVRATILYCRKLTVG